MRLERGPLLTTTLQLDQLKSASDNYVALVKERHNIQSGSCFFKILTKKTSVEVILKI